MPRELKRAGFDVMLLAPRDSFAAHTAFADRIGHLPEGLTLYHWVQALLGAMRAAAPALIPFTCDAPPRRGGVAQYS